MKKLLNFCTIFWLILPADMLASEAAKSTSPAGQEFTRIDAIGEVLEYARDVDLIVFDIDLTVIAPLSGDEAGNKIDWSNTNYFDAVARYAIHATVQKHSCKVVDAIRQIGINADDFLVKKIFENYLHQIAVHQVSELLCQYTSSNPTAEPIETEIYALIGILKAQHIPILFYTTREWNSCAETEKQLKQAHIIVDTGMISGHKLVVMPEKNKQCGFGFEHGILYWIRNKSYPGPYDQAKGPILLDFLDAIHVCPRKIIFVDDAKERIGNFKSLYESRGIGATPLWYRGVEKRIKPVDALSEADLHVLNSFLPRDWQYLTFDLHEAVDFVGKELRK